MINDARHKKMYGLNNFLETEVPSKFDKFTLNY